jgi:hypothetical protein
MASLGEADGFVLSRADGNGGGGVRSVDAVGHRSLILILVAVNETIEDVITTGEGEWVEGAPLKLGRIRVALIEEIAASGPSGPSGPN